MGERVGQYELDDEPLAIGGMGAVFRARDAQGRRVAIKRMHPALTQSPEAVERVRREAAALVQLRGHPNVVRVLALVENPLAIAMEYLEGESFDAILGREPHLPLTWVVDQFRQVAAALAFAHEQGVLHRDLKPANVMLARVDDHQVVKVLDFGLARLAEGPRGLTRDGQRMGTTEYMAPEQHRGEAVDARTDVYALGVLLFALATGRPPFELGSGAYPSDFAVARAHLEEVMPAPSSRRPDVPAWIDAVVARATRKVPAERFANARALLAACVEPAPVVGPAPAPAAPAPVILPTPVILPAPAPLVVRAPPRLAARPAHLGWWLAGVFTVAALALAWRLRSNDAPRPPSAAAPVSRAAPSNQALPEPPAAPRCGTVEACRQAAIGSDRPAPFEAEGCRLGDFEACASLANRHSAGKDVPQNRIEAARLRRMACEGGHAGGCNDLAHQLEYGRGVSQDPEEAVRLYVLACKQGHWLACSNAGTHHVKRDPAAAATYLRRACDAPCDPKLDEDCQKGRTAGCRRLGKLYQEGNGVPLDLEKGRALIQWACHEGNQEACKQLSGSR